LGELLPQVADTFLITGTEGMGPGLRRDDVENFVRSFLGPSVIAARKSLRVNGGFSEPPSRRNEGDGTPKGAPW
jgi:hypothetical protein